MKKRSNRSKKSHFERFFMKFSFFKKVEEGANLVKAAIMAGVNNDLGSGTMCNLVIIRKDKEAELRMGLDEVASKKATIPPVPQMNFAKGATTFIKEDIRKLVTITDGDVEMA